MPNEFPLAGYGPPVYSSGPSSFMDRDKNHELDLKMQQCIEEGSCVG